MRLFTPQRTSAAIDFVEIDPHPALARVVGAMLASCSARSGDDVDPVDLSADSDWPAIWGQLCQHRIEGFLSQATAVGTVVVSAAQAEVVASRARSIAFRQLRLRSALADLQAQLDAQGIELRVLKGLATGPLDHDHAASRRTADVDVLVHAGDFEKACETILDSGCKELKEGLPAHLLVERTFRNDDGAALDIHHRLFRFGRDDEGELFRDPAPIAGTGSSALPAHARLVHAAAHLLISPPGHRQMSSLFDVAVLAPKVDMSRAETLADRFGVRDILRFAVWIADSLAEPRRGDPAPAAATSLINRAHVRTRRRADLEALAVLQAANGTGERVALIRHQVAQARRRRA